MIWVVLGIIKILDFGDENMKTNWKLQESSNLKWPKWSEEDIEKFINSTQTEIDRDMFERYEWDWEFRNLVDKIKIVGENKNES